MTGTGKCTSWMGHKFEARYSEAPLGPVKYTDFGSSEMTEYCFLRLAEMKRERTYERDVCVRCGATIEKHIEVSGSQQTANTLIDLAI